MIEVTTTKGVLRMAIKGGKKPVYAYYNGEMVMVKALTKFGNSYGVILPNEWITIQGGAESIKHILLEVRDTLIVIKPCFEKLDAGELNK